MGTEGFDNPPAIGHVAEQPPRLMLDEARGAGEPGGWRGVREQRHRPLLEGTCEEAAPEAHRVDTAEGPGKPFREDVERQKPPVEPGGGDRPLEQILRRVAGGRATEERDDVLEGRAGHALHENRSSIPRANLPGQPRAPPPGRGPSHPWPLSSSELPSKRCFSKASAAATATRRSAPSLLQGAVRKPLEGEDGGGDEAGVVADRIEVGLGFGQIPIALVECDRLGEMLHRRRRVAR